MTSNFLHLWHIPSSKIYLSSPKFPKGLFSVSGTEVHAPLCFCRKLQTTTYEVVKASYVPAIRVKPDIEKQEKTPAIVETVGAFQRLPMVKHSIEILYSAIRKAKQISPTKGIVNVAKREKNKGARQLDTLMKELGVPLREYMETFPNKKHLHPYERALIELTLGDGNYEEIIQYLRMFLHKLKQPMKFHHALEKLGPFK